MKWYEFELISQNYYASIITANELGINTIDCIRWRSPYSEFISVTIITLAVTMTTQYCLWYPSYTCTTWIYFFIIQILHRARDKNIEDTGPREWPDRNETKGECRLHLTSCQTVMILKLEEFICFLRQFRCTIETI